MHEHLPELGIIDMGGRMYDARTCQFLSPDPYMQAPGSWLNHNRYAYCLQNPVMYTDPDGESILAAIAIGAIVGGGINYGIKKYNGQINSVGDAFAAFGWGALGGAAGTYAAVTIGPTLAGAGFLGGFAIGMASSFANSVVLSFGNNRSFGDPVMGPNEMIFNSMLGGLMCGIGNGILSKIAGRNFWNGSAVPQDVEAAVEPVKLETPKQQPQKLTPYQKGQEGVRMAEEEIAARGGKVVAYEVTLEVNGVRVRVDIAADFNGEIRLIEVKNGPSASYTPNQKIVYPQMKENVPVIPRGKNAGKIEQFDIGAPTIKYKFEVIWYNK